MGNNTKTVTDASFDADVLQADRPGARRLLGRVVRAVPPGRPGSRGDRRRVRRQAHRRQAEHRREPGDRPQLPGHVHPDHGRVHQAARWSSPSSARARRPRSSTSSATTLAERPTRTPAGGRHHYRRRCRRSHARPRWADVPHGAGAAAPHGARRRRGTTSARPTPLGTGSHRSHLDRRGPPACSHSAAATEAATSPKCAGCWPPSDCWTTPTDSSADVFDESAELAVRHFQQRRGISVDGRVDEETLAALIGAHWRLGDRVLAHDRGPPAKSATTSPRCRTSCSNSVTTYAVPTAVFGARTADALRAFQRDYGLVPDGDLRPRNVAGPTPARPPGGRRAAPVAARVGRGRRRRAEPARQADRHRSRPRRRRIRGAEHDGHRRGRARLGPRQPPGRPAAALGVQHLAHPRSAQRRHRRAAGGARQRRRRRPGALPARRRIRPRHAPTAWPRTTTAAASPARRSASGSPTWSSASWWPAPGMLDSRIHGKTWALLRLTRMPAVRVELGYLTSPVDRPRLADPLFRDTVAEGLLVAVQRLYLPTADDPPTGVLRIPAQAQLSVRGRRQRDSTGACIDAEQPFDRVLDVLLPGHRGLHVQPQPRRARVRTHRLEPDREQVVGRQQTAQRRTLARPPRGPARAVRTPRSPGCRDG